MALANWFWKHYNNDVTGVGKAPLRKRFSKFRQSRITPRLKRFRESRIKEKKLAGAKKLQDKEGIKPDTQFRLMGIKKG